MHTPGPWEVYEVEDGPYNEVIARGICESRHGVGLNHGEQYELFSEDDARLIAAAPDLLAACENANVAFGLVWRALDGLYGANFGERLPIAALDDDRRALFDALLDAVPVAGEMLEAAIAKARGEATS